MLAVYLPVSAYSNGIACSTGIVIPCLMNGALIGRLFGLLMTDLLGVHRCPSACCSACSSACPSPALNFGFFG